MPEGIVIIEWDEGVGGIVGLKYPENLEIPDNFVQILQISHNFNPGVMTIKEQGISAISLGNQELQKVIVLVLTKYEDADDYKDIIQTINEAVTQSEDPELLLEELKRLFQAAQSVFRAREAVLMKLANEIADLKNSLVDMKNSIEWLNRKEKDPQKRIIYNLLLHGAQSDEELRTSSKLSKVKLEPLLREMAEEKIIERKEGQNYLIVHYQVQ